MAVTFRIDQATPGAGETDQSRHDLVANEPIVLTVVEPDPSSGATYRWELIDRAGTQASLSADHGVSVTLGASSKLPFAFLVELRAYAGDTLIGSTRRICGGRTPKHQLRLPMFLETADPTAKLGYPNADGSTDNALYEDLAGTSTGTQNWRGWAEFLFELVMALEGITPGAQPTSAALVLAALAQAATDIDVAGKRVKNAADPQAAQDLATRAYVDAHAGGGGGGGTGDVAGPASAFAHAVPRFGDGTGKTLENTSVSIDDSGSIYLNSGSRIDGRDPSVDGAKLDAIEAGAQVTSFARVQTALATASSDIGVNNRHITSLADPVNPQDAATRAFVLANVGGGGGGGVSGPGSSTTNALARFSGTTGAALSNSVVVVDNAGNIAIPNGATVDGRDPSADGGKLDAIEAGAQITNFARVQTALAGATASVAFNNKTLSSVADPVNAQDAATKSWVLAAVGSGGGGGGGVSLLDGDVTGAPGTNVVGKVHGIVVGSIETGTAGQVLTLVDNGDGTLSIGAQTPATGSAPGWSLVQEYDFTTMDTNTTIQTDGSTRYLEWFGAQATLSGNGTVGVEGGLGLVMSPQAGEETGFDWSRTDALTINFPVWLHWRNDVAIVYELAAVRESGGTGGAIVDGEVIGVHLGHNVGGPSDGYVYHFDDVFRGTQLAAQRVWSNAAMGVGRYQLLASLRVGVGTLRDAPPDPEVISPEKIGLLALENGVVELHNVSDWPNDNEWAQQPDQWTSGGNGPALQTRMNGEMTMAPYRYRSFGFHAAHMNTGLNRVVISRVQVYTR